MHRALPTLLPGRRHPRRFATLIRRRPTRRKSRSRMAAVLVSALAVASAGTVLAVLARSLRPLPLLGRLMPSNAASADAGPVDDGPASPTVRTEPPGARVVLDGRARGRTPLQIHTSSGPHALLLEADGSISTAEPVDLASTGTVLDVALWTRHPTLQHLRSPYPRRATGGCSVPCRRRRATCCRAARPSSWPAREVAS
jgi:hypothetical protein